MGAEVDEAERQRDISENPHLVVWHNFTFDWVYDQQSTQDFLYENTAQNEVDSVLAGYNATILAYGQTGTGKTHTMEGFKYSGCDPQRGIVPRSMEQIFKYIEKVSNRNSTFMVRASYLQIYNEVISDLLKTDRTSLNIREDKKKGIFVEGLSEWAVRSPIEIYSLMQKGAVSRNTAQTNMNDVSSRSHAVFLIIVEQMKVDKDKQIKVGKLNLVDLAGSESVRVTGATGKRLEESKSINQSLSCLGNVIAALTDTKTRSHIPYRDSKLTRFLKDSLGGNCKTTMMVMVSPAPEAFTETLSTLKFATRAKKIKNEAKINEDVDQRALLRKYETELKKLKQALEDQNNRFSNNGQIQVLEEERRRAEEDKAAAINALEVRSREYMIERDEKKKLEEKIRIMKSQVLTGGHKVEETDQFRQALEKKQKTIREEYEKRLKSLEEERIMIEDDISHVDKYKKLLIKQSNIMVALTNRLNVRDETIIQLQEELDAYDKIHRETEINIEMKSERIGQLQSFIESQGLQGPEGYHELEHIQDRMMNQKRYVPYEEEGKEIDYSQQIPMRLLTAEEKIYELGNVIEEYRAQQDMHEQEKSEMLENKAELMRDQINDIVNREVNERLSEQGEQPSQEILDSLRAEQQKSQHLVQEKMVISDILKNDIMSVSGQLAQNIDMNRDQPGFNQIADPAIEVYQKLNELVESMNLKNESSNAELSQSIQNQSEYSERSDSVLNRGALSDISKHSSISNQSAIDRNMKAEIQMNSSIKSNSISHNTSDVYERRLPPNVEEMLRVKREKLAHQLSANHH